MIEPDTLKIGEGECIVSKIEVHSSAQPEPDTNPKICEEEESAIRIQAAYRGKKVREET